MIDLARRQKLNQVLFIREVTPQLGYDDCANSQTALGQSGLQSRLRSAGTWRALDDVEQNA